MVTHMRVLALSCLLAWMLAGCFDGGDSSYGDSGLDTRVLRAIQSETPCYSYMEFKSRCLRVDVLVQNNGSGVAEYWQVRGLTANGEVLDQQGHGSALAPGGSTVAQVQFVLKPDSILSSLLFEHNGASWQEAVPSPSPPSVLWEGSAVSFVRLESTQSGCYVCTQAVFRIDAGQAGFPATLSLSTDAANGRVDLPELEANTSHEARVPAPYNAPARILLGEGMIRQTIHVLEEDEFANQAPASSYPAAHVTQVFVQAYRESGDASVPVQGFLFADTFRAFNGTADLQLYRAPFVLPYDAVKLPYTSWTVNFTRTEFHLENGLAKLALELPPADPFFGYYLEAEVRVEETGATYYAGTWY